MVIGIIGVLVGLLLPVLVRARDQAQLAKCLANEHAILLATNVLVGQHDGIAPLCGQAWLGFTSPFTRIPVTITPTSLNDTSMQHYVYAEDLGEPKPLSFFSECALVMGAKLDTSSRAALQASLDTPEVTRLFVCPSDANPARGQPLVASDGWSAPYQTASYDVNEEAVCYRDWNGYSPRGRLTRVHRPAMVALLTDGTCRSPNPGPELFDLYAEDPDSTLDDYATVDAQYWHLLDYRRHHGRINVGFCDGHAESVDMGTPTRSNHGHLDQIGVSRGVYY